MLVAEVEGTGEEQGVPLWLLWEAGHSGCVEIGESGCTGSTEAKGIAEGLWAGPGRWAYHSSLLVLSQQIAKEVAKLLEMKAQLGGDEGKHKFVLKTPKVTSPSAHTLMPLCMHNLPLCTHTAPLMHLYVQNLRTDLAVFALVSVSLSAFSSRGERGEDIPDSIWPRYPTNLKTLWCFCDKPTPLAGVVRKLNSLLVKFCLSCPV